MDTDTRGKKVAGRPRQASEWHCRKPRNTESTKELQEARKGSPLDTLEGVGPHLQVEF